MARIDGTPGDDMLHGTTLADEIYGYDGIDSLYGEGGNDWLIGGAGGDTLSGGDGIDAASYMTSSAGVVVTLGGTASGGDAAGDIIAADVEGLVGSRYADTLIGNAADNELHGYAGLDFIDAAGGDDNISGAGQLYGGDGNDRIFGAGQLDGGDGNDRVEGGQSTDDVLRGGSGDDWLYGGMGIWNEFGDYEAGTDSYSGGDGIDIVSFTGEGEVHDFSGPFILVATIGGTARVDHEYGHTTETLPDDIEGVEGTHFNDQIIGNAGDNILIGGYGADDLRGGDGNDTVGYERSRSAVFVVIGGESLSGGDAEGDWIGSDVENIVGSNFGDFLGGSGAANVLSGLDGDDSLDGDAGADRLDGGAGSDRSSYYASSVGVRVDLALGTGTGGDAEGDILVSIENLTGSASADTLIGSSVANLLRGDNGDDILRGGAGADTLDGGDGFDLVTYFDSVIGVTANLTAGAGSGGTAAGDTLISIEAVNGSAYADTLTGDGADNIFRGAGGNDILRGGDGSDVLRGGIGADTLDGGTGFDQVTYFDSGAGVTVNLAAGTGSGGTAAGDILVSIEAVNGSAHDDALIGDDDANTLKGAGGKDLLTGGGGADRFVLVAIGDSAVGAADADRIIDFSQAQADRIDLSQIDANGSAAGNGAFSFIGTSAFAGVAGQLRYEVVGGDVVIAGDIDGDTVSDFNIVLSNVGSVQAADFVL